MTNSFRTRPVRPSAPSVARAGAEVLAALAKKTKYADPALADHWPTIAGEKIADLCRPGRINGHGPGRTLEVYAPSGAAAAELQMLTEGLLARVNRYLGTGAVAKIAIRQRAAFPSEGAVEGEGRLEQALASFRSAINRRNDKK